MNKNLKKNETMLHLAQRNSQITTIKAELSYSARDFHASARVTWKIRVWRGHLIHTPMNDEMDSHYLQSATDVNI